MSDRQTDKSAQAFRTISEVADELGLATHVLRFWESKFPQIKPTKRAGGRRYYRPDDVALLRRLQTLLHDEGYTIKGVQKLLREEGPRRFIDQGYATDQDVENIPEPAEVIAEIASPPLGDQANQPPSPQGSLFDAPPEPTQIDQSPTFSEPMAQPVSESPVPVIRQGLSLSQKEALHSILGELEAIKEKLTAARAI